MGVGMGVGWLGWGWDGGSGAGSGLKGERVMSRYSGGRNMDEGLGEGRFESG